MKPGIGNLFLAIAIITLSFVSFGGSSAHTSAMTGMISSGNNGSATLENLQAAFNGESNAHAKYLAFAKRADEEGYTKVASLFRAAARAEEIHFNNHAVVIRKMGGEPNADIKSADVKTTAENLKAAIEGETYERDKMYPDFMAEARSSGNTDAFLTFRFAKTAEAEHAKLYTEALANLENWKGAKGTFFVCPKCGYTTSDVNLQKCPVDSTPKERFETIS